MKLLLIQLSTNNEMVFQPQSKSYRLSQRSFTVDTKIDKIISNLFKEEIYPHNKEERDWLRGRESLSVP